MTGRFLKSFLPTRKALKRVVQCGITVLAVYIFMSVTVEYMAVRVTDTPTTHGLILRRKKLGHLDENTNDLTIKLDLPAIGNKIRKFWQSGKVLKGDSTKQKRSKTNKMQAIVIVASFRTGSSFVGQLFNQHPQVFYLFEPLFFSIWERQKVTPTNKVIEDLLLCNMTSMRRENFNAWNEARKTFQADQNQPARRKLRDMTACMAMGLCFRSKSKALCTEEMCGVPRATNCQYHCYRPPEPLVQNSCKTAKVRVLKVIRINDLKMLESSSKNKNIDLRIIHLVRDPRPTLLSRTQLSRIVGKNTGAIIKTTCDRNFEIHSQYLSNRTEFAWLKGKYKLIRYEDVIENPAEQVKMLYDFLNFPEFHLHTEVTKWLEGSTTSTDLHQFGTSRDANRQKYKWRLEIPFELADVAQKTCKNMMGLFGYKLADSQISLRNLNDSLLKDIKV